MSGFSISGLASNINTSAIITQMMQINQMPQQLLMNEQTASKTALTAYQAINSKFQALQTASQALSDLGAMNATAATSSDNTVAVSTTSANGATVGSMTFQVQNTAQTAASVSSSRWSSTAAAYGGTTPIAIYDPTGATQIGSVTVTGKNGNPPTLQDAIDAINSNGSYSAGGQTYKMAAAAVQTAPGQYALQVSAVTSGSAANFTLAPAEFKQLSAGVDATLQVGSGAGAYTVASPTNAFTGLMPGVNVAISQATPLHQNITVSVGTDVDGLTKKMQSLVSAFNAVYSEINADTDTTGAASSSGGASTVTAALPNDFAMQNLQQGLLKTIGDAIVTSTGTNGTMADLGLKTDKYGTLTLDTNAFQTALKTNPAQVTALVQGNATNPGLAAKLATFATSAIDPVKGTVTASINALNGPNGTIATLQGSIDAWDVRLTAMRASLTNQFNAMETALGQLQSQQQWMSSMFNASFGSSSSSSNNNKTVNAN